MMRVRKHGQIQRDDDSSTAYTSSIGGASDKAVAHPYAQQQQSHRPRKRRRTIVDQLQNCTLDNASAGGATGCGSSSAGGGGGGGTGIFLSRHHSNRQYPKIPTECHVNTGDDVDGITSSAFRNDDNSLLSEDEPPTSTIITEGNCFPPLEDVVVVGGDGGTTGGGENNSIMLDPEDIDCDDDSQRLETMTDEEKAQRAIMLELVLGKDHPKTKAAAVAAAAATATPAMAAPVLPIVVPKNSVVGVVEEQPQQLNNNNPISTFNPQQQDLLFLPVTTTSFSTSVLQNNNNPIDTKIESMIRESLRKANKGENPMAVGVGPTTTQQQKDDMYLDTVYNTSTATAGSYVNSPPTRQRSNSLPSMMEVEDHHNNQNQPQILSTAQMSAAIPSKGSSVGVDGRNVSTSSSIMDMD